MQKLLLHLWNVHTRLFCSQPCAFSILSAYCSASISLYKETHLPLGEAEEVVMMLEERSLHLYARNKEKAWL